MIKNEHFLAVAESLKPELYETECIPQNNGYRQAGLKKGDTLRLDFGTHLTGYVTLRFGYQGAHPDAPAWVRLKFAERECELSDQSDVSKITLSTSWIQWEQLHIDVLPSTIKLHRRYAFRYLELEVLDTGPRFQLTLEDARCTAVTSADESALLPYASEPRLEALDAAACLTLRECMQDVFEDGPKRDRRLWLGDLRLQALANYETYRNFDLVKRCLYLFAGDLLEDGRVGGCLYTRPRIEVDDMRMFDYPLLFIPSLLDYYNATGDTETLRELAPVAFRQVALANQCFDAQELARESEQMGWCFVDWANGLDKQASAQGIYLYSLKAAIQIADLLEDAVLSSLFRDHYARKHSAAELLWDEEKQFYISGPEKQISWASQVWLTLGGAAHGSPELLVRLKNSDALPMVTPYMYHNYVDALLSVGAREEAYRVLTGYWGGMLDEGADTFWELYNPENPDESPYGGTIINSYCHAWSCAPAYFLRKFFA